MSDHKWNASYFCIFIINYTTIFTYLLVLFNYSSKIFKTGFKTGIPVLEFLNTDKPVLKIAIGIESPTEDTIENLNCEILIQTRKLIKQMQMRKFRSNENKLKEYSFLY
jgi:hypothetical protein